MPTEQSPPVIQDVNLETEPFKDALDKLSDAYALTLVNKTFFQYDSYRQQNHDPRWNVNDSLYLGWMAQRNWVGTTTPRSALSMPIVFDQVESALPAIQQALFNQPDWFQVQAEPGASAQEARDQASKLLYDLEHNKDGFGLSARNDLEIAIKAVLTYGNGGIAVEYDPAKNRPVVSWLDLRDLYLDPGATIPAIDYCRSVIRRSLKTVEEIREWRGMPGMKIPEDGVLWGMARNQVTTQADRTKQIQDAYRGINFVPGSSDFLPNPGDRRVEILTYYTRTRIIMVFNREWVAFSGTNPYGFIPFCVAPCYTVVGRWYAMGVPDVQEGNQRYIEALLNGRLDEISLALHPPRVTKASSLLTPAQQRWAPGAVTKAVNPKDDVQFFNPTGATANVYSEIDFIQTAAEKRTGINSLSTGVPQASNANRTASGMQMQLQGSSLRLTTIVKHIEDYLIVPMLYKMARMTEIHAQSMEEGATFPGMDKEGNVTDIPAASFLKPVRFRMLASSQMVTREKLAQMFPYIFQYLAQGPMVANLLQQGLTVDWKEIFQMMQDASGVGRLYQLVRQMTPEEQQQLAQQQQQQAAAAQQEKQMDSQTRLQMGQMKMQSEREKGQVELQKEAMKAQKSPQEMQAEQQKLEMDMARMQMEMQFEREKIAMEREKMVMKLRETEMMGQVKAQQAQLDVFLSQQKAQVSAQVESQRGEFESLRMEREHEHAEAKMELDRKAAEQKASLGGPPRGEEKPVKRAPKPKD